MCRTSGSAALQHSMKKCKQNEFCVWRIDWEISEAIYIYIYVIHLNENECAYNIAQYIFS